MSAAPVGIRDWPAKRILAIGGGGFLMEDGPSPVDRFILQLTGKARPRVCYVGTPNGDMPDGIEKFYAAFPPGRCEPSHLAFFRKPSHASIPLADFGRHLLAQDAIFVAGGNTKSALGVWREWGVDRVFAQAYAAGILLCGMSAGAMCWFEAGLTDSYWGAGYRPLPCLGLLPGACAVHYQSDPERRVRLHAAVAAGALCAPVVAIDDGCAVLYEEGAIGRVVRWQAGAGAVVVPATSGPVQEVACESVFIT